MTLNRVRDFVLYAVIGAAMYVGVIWFASEGGQRESLAKWGGLALFSAVLFGSVIVKRRRSILRLSFWLVLLVVLAIHLALFVVLLRQVNEWKAIWWALLYPIETIAVDATMSFWGPTSGPQRNDVSMRGHG